MTDYSSLEEVLRAIRDLPYEGGSRRIGDALQFLVDHVFSPVISPDHTPKVQCTQGALRVAQLQTWKKAQIK